MSRLILTAALMVGGVVATQPTASANPYGCANLGCGGFCFKFLGLIHQHGPLYNYGPYSGYYPFEPYGPWNSQLQYTGPGRNDGYSCGPLGNCGRYGLLGHGGSGRNGLCSNCGGGLGSLGSRFHAGGNGVCSNCNAWGNYANVTYGNILKRTNPRNLFGRCHGCKDAPVVSVPSCEGCAVASEPVQLESNPVVPTSYRINDR